MNAAADLPMWCDDFDMDLPKVIPQARAMLGDLAGFELRTHGHTTFGRLNNPTSWNHELGLVAFFEHRIPKEPYYVTRDPLVTCTFWEAVRDGWSHGFVMLVDGEVVIDFGALQRRFERLMYTLRGWSEVSQAEIEEHHVVVLDELKKATQRLREIA